MLYVLILFPLASDGNMFDINNIVHANSRKRMITNISFEGIDTDILTSSDIFKFFIFLKN